MIKKLLILFYILPLLTRGQGILVGDTSSAGIIYTFKDTIIHVTPHGTTTADIDLDNDNIKDIRFYISNNYSPGFTQETQQIYSLNNLEFVFRNASNIYLDSIAPNVTIDNGLNWNSSNPAKLFDYFYSAGSYNISGVFLDLDNYIGFRKKTLTDTIYGWILVNAGLYSGIKIKSWAYQSNSINLKKKIDQTILLNIFPNPSQQEIKINYEAINSSVIKVINSNGQEIYSEKFNVINKTIMIDISKFQAGSYIIEISNEKELTRGKFIKN